METTSHQDAPAAGPAGHPPGPAAHASRRRPGTGTASRRLWSRIADVASLVAKSLTATTS